MCVCVCGRVYEAGCGRVERRQNAAVVEKSRQGSIFGRNSKIYRSHARLQACVVDLSEEEEELSENSKTEFKDKVGSVHSGTH